MKDNFWNKKIPTLLGLFLITLTVLGTALLVKQQTFFTQEASGSTQPIDVRITNVTNSSFSVSYLTGSSLAGSINLVPGDSGNKTILDDNDKGGFKEHKVHAFTVKNLSPLTKYSFSILSGQDTYLNNGAYYQVKTGPLIKDNPPSGFLVGKLVTAEGVPPKEGLVYITLDGANTLSGTVKSDGSYTLSFENLRTDDLGSFFKFSNTSVIKILAVSDEGSSKINIGAKEIVNVPTIILSKNYDFLTSETKTATSSAKVSQLPKINNSKNVVVPKIISPSDKQMISDSEPLFKGVGQPGDKIKILIQSNNEIQGAIVVDANGNWTFKPSIPLSPGEHTITITAKDSLGILRTISQTFTVQTAEAAGASATPTPKPTPTPTPNPSPSPITIPASTASPAATIEPTPVPTLPPTGSSEISTGIMGIALFAIGGLFFILSRLIL